MNNPLLTARQIACIEQTKSSELSWKSDRLTPDQVIARDAFFQLVRHGQAAAHTDLMDHPFWMKWRSAKSGDQKNILFFAAQEAQDIQWVRTLLKMGLSEGVGQYAIFSLFNRNGDDVVPLLDMFSAYVPLDLPANHQVLREKIPVASLLEKAVTFGKWAAVEYLIAKGGAPTRPPAIEKKLFSTRILKSRSGSVFHDQALDALWNHWGQPNASELREAFKASLSKSKKTTSVLRGIARLSEVWNPAHPDWGKDDSLNLFNLYVLVPFVREFLNDKIQKGWIFPQDHWEEAFPAEMVNVSLSGQMQEWVLELFALRDKVALNHALQDVDSAAKRKSKI